MPQWMLYGATGFTGRLLAKEALARGHRPILAGRDVQKLRRLGDELGLPIRAAPLTDSNVLRDALSGVSLVLHAAGPFVETAEPMRAACLQMKAHYLDITGELPVFQASFRQDEQAKAARCCIMSGVGFDVVPTDCLALHLARQLPAADTLELFISSSTRPSSGTAKSAVGMFVEGGYVLREGRLVPLQWGDGIRRLQILDRERTVIPVPLGDLVTSHRSTGIANITVYLTLPRAVAVALHAVGPVTTGVLQHGLRSLVSKRRVREQLNKLLERTFAGEGADAQAAKTQVWGRVKAPTGESKEAWIDLADGYSFTADIAVTAVEEVLAKNPTGALSPAQAFGPDFVLRARDIRRISP